MKNKSDDRVSKIANLLTAAVALLLLYPACACMAGRSEVPVWFGRYSSALTSVILWMIVLYGYTFHVLIGSCCYRTTQFVFGSWVILSFILVGVTAVRNLPYVSVIFPGIRLFVGIAGVFYAFHYFKAQQRAPQLWLAISFFLISISILDFFLVGTALLKKTSEYSNADPRMDYAYEQLSERDILIVGDSFVWGGGVDRSQRFGNQLEAIYDKTKQKRKVLSTAIPGGALPDYARLLDAVPEGLRVKRVIIAFYLNDIPSAPSLELRFYHTMLALGASSYSLKWIGDFWGKKLWADVDGYHRSIAAMYDPESPMMEARWGLLTGQIQRLSRLAQPHSIERPIFIIIPLMMNYENYPLRIAHRQIAEVAEKAGFESLDLLPFFEKKLKDGDAYRAAENDNHMNAEAHRFAAEIIYGVISPSLQTGGALNEAAA